MLALPSAPAPARPRTLLVATAFASVGVMALIGGMLGAYVHVRDEAGGTTAAWLADDVILPEVATNIMLITMVFASFTVQWAYWAISRNDRRHTYLALALTAIFGVAVLNGQIYVYQELAMPIANPDDPASSRYAMLVYAVTGTFVALLVAGIVFAAVMAFRTLGGRYSARDNEGLAATALYWHVLTAVFVAVWYVVYVVK
jgi:heme/copper-type cytochrome/quinol oxidase subunit 3